ncbi:hypothetical protein J7E70_22675 [Variovorax paradoxus]|nr:hypothetical protein [Variovorax paradoxus]MBT2303257.1 hypothetical protein [Variovorax paradoxus]
MKLCTAAPQVVLVLAMAVIAAGCGGGGGGGMAGSGGTATVSDTQPVTPPPSATPPPDSGGAAGSRGAAGTLIGHTISTTDFHGTAPDQTMILGPLDTVAGDGVELTNAFFADFVTIDFSATSIRITAATDQPFGYFEVLRFGDTQGTISSIASVTVDPATNYAGFNASRLTVTADAIDVNLTALSGRRGQQILLNIAFAAP